MAVQSPQLRATRNRTRARNRFVLGLLAIAGFTLLVTLSVHNGVASHGRADAAAPNKAGTALQRPPHTVARADGPTDEAEPDLPTRVTGREHNAGDATPPVTTVKPARPQAPAVTLAPTPVVYCDGESEAAKIDLQESVPHNKNAPASVIIGTDPQTLEEAGLQLGLEGAVAAMHIPPDHKHLENFGPGWYCLSAVDTKEGCIAQSKAFVVTDDSRGGNEYAAVPSGLRRLPFRHAVLAHKPHRAGPGDSIDDDPGATITTVAPAVDLTVGRLLMPIRYTAHAVSRLLKLEQEAAAEAATLNTATAEFRWPMFVPEGGAAPVMVRLMLDEGGSSSHGAAHRQPARRKMLSEDNEDDAGETRGRTTLAPFQHATRARKQKHAHAQQHDAAGGDGDNDAAAALVSDAPTLKVKRIGGKATKAAEADSLRAHAARKLDEHRRDRKAAKAKRATPAPRPADKAEVHDAAASHRRAHSAKSGGGAAAPADDKQPYLGRFVKLHLRKSEENALVRDVDEESYVAPDAATTVEVYRGLGSTLLQPPRTGSVPWRGDKFLQTDGKRVTPLGLSDSEKGQQGADAAWATGECPMRLANCVYDAEAPACKPKLRVHYVPLKLFTPVDSGAAFAEATAAAVARPDVAPGNDATEVVVPACRVRVTHSIDVAEATVPAGCVLALDHGVILTVTKRLTVAGTATQPVLFTRSKSPLADHNQPGGGKSVHANNWGGIAVAHGATLTIQHTFLTFGGGSTRREKGTGTHIKDACPIITAATSATVRVSDSALLHSRGPGIGAGMNAKITVQRTLFNDLAQGGECVGCRITIVDSVLANFFLRPRPKDWVDKDNDGFYFRGGTAHVHGTTVVNMLDDCIDTASSKGDDTVSTLNITNSFLGNCMHEGVALSASVGTQRRVHVANSHIAWVQQGVENGYTPDTHTALFEDVTFTGNEIAARYGDNYHLAVNGVLKLDRCVFRNNRINVLNIVKKDSKQAELHRGRTTILFDKKVQPITVVNSVFVAPSERAHKAASAAALKQHALAQHQGRNNPHDKKGKPPRAAVDPLLEEDSDDLAVREFAKTSGVFSTVDYTRGVLCGMKHFNAEGNSVVDAKAEAYGEAGCMFEAW